MRSCRLILLALLALGAACSTGPSRRRPAVAKRAAAPVEGARLQLGFAPPADRARRPRFRADQQDERGLQVLPDGKLREWEAAGTTWIEIPPPAKRPASWTGADDLQAQLALASYRNGLSLAIRVKDDVHLGARSASALRRSDHVEVSLWPGRRPSSTTRPADRALGLRFRLGTVKQLVEILRPADEPWREAALASFGAAVPGGYQIEARLPLPLLTPLPSGSVDTVHYRVAVFDTDARETAAEAKLVVEGSARLDPPLLVPEAVQKRASLRACMAAEPDALWGYENGWRCSIPYAPETLPEDDGAPPSTVRLGHSLLTAPPTLTWIRERVIFVNLAGVQRGVAALYDKKSTLLSLMRLGVFGAFDPGNAQAKDSDVEPIKLPDETWAVAVTHAYPARARQAGGRCAAGHVIYLSIIALRGCLVSTPFAPAPEPEKPPYLEEIFRATLEDCEESVANDWTLSKDRKTIRVHSSLYPSRGKTTYTFKDGRYLPNS
jgi:hypothetical protein